LFKKGHPRAGAPFFSASILHERTFLFLSLQTRNTSKPEKGHQPLLTGKLLYYTMSSSVFQRKDIPVVNIGKKGLDEAVLEEIKNVLKARGIVKVKLLKNFREAYGLSPEEAAVVLSQRLSAEIVGVRGFVIVLKKAIRGH